MPVFRRASADALASLTKELEASSGAAAAATGSALFQVATTLRSEGALRRFATDAALPVDAKTGLVQQVFGGKLDDAAMRILSSAVSKRWTVARDLADVLEQLSVVASVRSVGDDSGRLSDELFVFNQTVKDNPELRDALSDPARSHSDKSALLDGLLQSKALPATVTLAKQALSGSYRTVFAALTEYQKVAAEVHGEHVATVRSARPLTDDELGRLTAALTSQYDRSIHLNLVIEPQLLGGLRVEIGDDVIDGSISSRIDSARRKIAG